MNTFLLIWAVVFFSAVAVPAQSDLIARIHFLGGDKISADPAHSAFTNEFCSAEAKALENQTLDKLANFVAARAKSTNSATQLRPLLDDLPKSEWIFEIRDTTNGSPEYALAIRLNEARYELWNTNLMAIFASWAGPRDIISVSNPLRWEWFRGEFTNYIRFTANDSWVLVEGGLRELSSRIEVPKSAVTTNGWLSVEANWPRLAPLFPALKEFDFPKIAMQIVGRDGNLQVNGKLTLSQPLPPLGNWRVPTNLIHQPLVSFTAARGIAPWLVKQTWMRPFAIQPQPDQVFIWAMGQIPFQTFAAEPVPDGTAALAQLYQQLSAESGLRSLFFDPVMLTMTNSEITWDMPFMMPNVRVAQGPGGDFLFGGFFPNPPKAPPPKPELLAPLNTPNLVCYHWEVTAEQLENLPQLSQLLLVLTRHEQVQPESAAGKWLDRIKPALGNAITEVTQAAPNELAFKRTAGCGLTAIELLALVDWLEAPKFPALDLRQQPPRVRPGRGTASVLPMPAAPAAPAK